MTEASVPVAVAAADVPVRTRPSIYPEPFAVRMQGREKRALGDRTPGEDVAYPDDDLQISVIDGKRKWAHKDGQPY
jgi:hypothetical protein